VREDGITFREDTEMESKVRSESPLERERLRTMPRYSGK
jgi:hypothetical protein